MIWVCTDWAINWNGVAAVGTLIAAVIALGGTFFTYRAAAAARASVREMQRQAISQQERIDEDRRRRLAPMSSAFQHELLNVHIELTRTLKALGQNHSATTKSRYACGHVSAIHTPLMDLMVSRLGDFDVSTGEKIALVWSGIRMLKAKHPPFAPDSATQYSQDDADTFLLQCKTLERHIQGATDLLQGKI